MNAVLNIDSAIAAKSTKVANNEPWAAIVDLLTCALNEGRKTNDKELQYLINMALIASKEKCLKENLK